MKDARARLNRLAWLLDSSIPIPGTPFSVGLDALIGLGMIPFAGDLFDAAFKANQRNVRLLNAYLDQPVGTRRASSLFLLGLAVALLLVLAVFLSIGVLLARWVWS